LDGGGSRLCSGGTRGKAGTVSAGRSGVCDGTADSRTPTPGGTRTMHSSTNRRPIKRRLLAHRF
jgi:hypothetical protein